MPVDGVDPRESDRKLADAVGGVGAAIIIIPLIVGMAVAMLFVIMIPIGVVVSVIREIWSLF